MKNSARPIIAMTILMTLAAILTIIACALPSYNHLVFAISIIGSLICILWVAVLVRSVSY